MPSQSRPFRLSHQLFLSRSLITLLLSLFTGPSLFVIPSPSLLLFLVLASFALLSFSSSVAFSAFLALAGDLLLFSVSLRHFGHCVSVRSRLCGPESFFNSQSSVSSRPLLPSSFSISLFNPPFHSILFFVVISFSSSTFLSAFSFIYFIYIFYLFRHRERLNFRITSPKIHSDFRFTQYCTTPSYLGNLSQNIHPSLAPSPRSSSLSHSLFLSTDTMERPPHPAPLPLPPTQAVASLSLSLSTTRVVGPPFTSPLDPLGAPFLHRADPSFHPALASPYSVG